MNHFQMNPVQATETPATNLYADFLCHQQWEGSEDRITGRHEKEIRILEFGMPIELFERTMALRSTLFGAGSGIRSALKKSKL